MGRRGSTAGGRAHSVSAGDNAHCSRAQQEVAVWDFLQLIRRAKAGGDIVPGRSQRSARLVGSRVYLTKGTSPVSLI